MGNYYTDAYSNCPIDQNPFEWSDAPYTKCERCYNRKRDGNLCETCVWNWGEEGATKEGCAGCAYFREPWTCKNPEHVCTLPPEKRNVFSEKVKSVKVKTRRICDFCERGKRMNSEEGDHDLRLVKLTPVTPIDLTNPNEEEIKLGKPFYAMFLHDPEYGDEAATFQVKYCPFCGRKLVGE